jgi:hypothetical protein
MHFRKPRRSIPSALISLLSELRTMDEDASIRSVELLMIAPRGTNAVHLRELSRSIFIPASHERIQESD